MRRGVSRIGLSSVEPAERKPDALAPVRGENGAASPMRVHLIRLPADTTASHGCSAVLALHAAAIAHNLDCVLTTLDPEGPHQLRIALRRFRVALRVFRPVMEKKANTELTEAARALGGIVGELRDADVMIDEIIAPAARDQPAVMEALNAWRQEVRGRVRAKLLAMGTPAFTVELARKAATGAWSKRRDGGGQPAAWVIAAAIEAFREKAALGAARLPHLSHQELHRLRKDVKALRYGTDLAAAAGLTPAEAVRPLKRLQDLLGYANDMVVLEAFDPPVSGQGEALREACARIRAGRAGALADAVASAAALWRELSRAH